MNLDIFFYKVGQTLLSLTLTKPYMQTKKKRREYILVVLLTSESLTFFFSSSYIRPTLSVKVLIAKQNVIFR